MKLLLELIFLENSTIITRYGMTIEAFFVYRKER